ncbi:UDP-glycosyltransferase UGT4-like [Galleria mellonella]|uniref:UDP-glycosyltransferase UGT4-like n=1 Tax=Galleria mellonella TaxID=7137 RepID=A0ABM3MMX3_GALME|nr:UDP-glycosyltransferase UGT4-like [Galleria mellonella]
MFTVKIESASQTKHNQNVLSAKRYANNSAVYRGKISGRILSVLSAPLESHQMAMRPLTQELAKRGANVVVVTPLPVFTNESVPSNLHEIDVSYTTNDVNQILMEHIKNGIDLDLRSQKQLINMYSTEVNAAHLNSKEMQNVINDKNNTFDLILSEASPCKLNTILSYIFKAPMIHISSLEAHFNHLNLVGGVVHPLFYPDHTQKRFNNLTLWEKMKNLIYCFWLEQFEYHQEEMDTIKLYEMFGNNIPTITEMNNNQDNVLLLNTHRIWTNNRPVPLSVIYYGEIDQSPQRQLEQVLKSYLDSSQNGVIYVSFGTTVTVSDIPAEKLQMLLEVLSEMPYNILFKCKKDQFSSLPGNIKVLEWIPQPELLRHPNVKLFITQGGIHSTHEAIAAEVPLVAVPILGDQFYNAEKYRYHKIGEVINLQTTTVEQFKKTIEVVLEDESYRHNIGNLRKWLSDQPQPSLERAVWWTEHVLRYGAAHLRSPSANMSHAEYYEVELIIILFIIVLIISSILTNNNNNQSTRKQNTYQKIDTKKRIRFRARRCVVVNEQVTAEFHFDSQTTSVTGTK